METNYLIITLIVLSTIYAVINLLIYHVKREFYLVTFTLSFIFMGISFALLAYQTQLPAFIAYVVYNALNFVSYVMMLMGIRLVFNLRPVTRTAIIITFISLLLILLFSLLDYFRFLAFLNSYLKHYTIIEIIFIKKWNYVPL